jgi:hypothetical protein
MKRPNPQKLVDEFNSHVNVGDVVEYSEVIGVTDPVRYATESAAEVLGGHTAVLWLVGKRGCVAVAHCKPVTEASA